MVPPALLPQYSKTHPCVAAKNRDALRELGVASGKSEPEGSGGRKHGGVWSQEIQKF